MRPNGMPAAPRPCGAAWWADPGLAPGFRLALWACVPGPAGKPGSPGAGDPWTGADVDPAAAVHHKVHLLLWERLRSGADGASGERAARLEPLAVSALRRQERLVGEWGRLLRVFAAAPVEVLTLKGPALAARLYGGPSLRVFDDLDFLVRPADRDRAATALREAGYVPLRTYPPAAERWRRLAGWEDTYRHPEQGFTVEVDTGLAPAFYALGLDARAMWPRAAAVRDGTRGYLVPGDADLVRLLCIHGAKHFWSRMYWLADFARAVAAMPGAVAEALGGAARPPGLRRQVALGCALCRDALGMRLPPEAEAAVREDPALPGLVRQVRGWLAAGEPPADPRARTRFNLAVRERRRDRVRHLALLALTPSDADWAAVALPARAWPLYAAIRPFRLARVLAHRRR